MKNIVIALIAFGLPFALPVVSYAQYGGGGAPVGLLGFVAGAPTAPAQPSSPAPAGRVLGASVYDFATDFGIGSSGPDVTALQQLLTTAGFYSGPLTGYFGALTKAAVIKYQTANNISPTSGYVGPLTRSLLNQGIAPTASQEQSSMLGQLYAQLVQALQELSALSRST